MTKIFDLILDVAALLWEKANCENKESKWRELSAGSVMHYCSVGMWEVGIWISVPSHLHQQMSGSASHWKYSSSYCCHAGVCNDSEKQWKLLWNNINLGWPLFWVSLMTTRSDKVHSNTSETKCLLVLVVYSLYCTYIQINERHVPWSIFLAGVLHYGALKS